MFSASTLVSRSLDDRLYLVCQKRHKIKMIFGDKAIVGPEKCFSPSNLLQYAESLIREAKLQEKRSESSANNYGWLKSKNIHNDYTVDNDLEELRPIIEKMTSESCTSIAVKLDQLTEETNISSTDLLTTFKKLLEEQDNMQMMETNVRRAKETKNVKKKVNKVQPELSPPGRQPTVCFIVDKEML